MEKRNPIVEELQEIGSSLAEYPADTPYQPVAGYFDQFPDLMLQLIRERSVELFREKALEPGQNHLPEPEQERDPYLFDENELSPTLSQLRSPFSVPDGYFDGLAGSIMDKLKNSAGTIPVLPKQESESAEEIAGLSPLLAGISKKMPYTLPDQYFGKLAQDLSSRVVALIATELQEPAKVFRGNFSGKIIRYATAAVIAGAMITAEFFLINRDGAGQQIVSAKGLEEKTAQTSDEDILRYLENQPAPSFDLQPISEDEIKDDAILDMLADVSDEELQQYVQYQSDEKQLFN